MKSKHYGAYINDQEFEMYKKSPEDFVANYTTENEKNNVLSSIDVYSLVLIKAIEKKDISVVDSILSLEHDGNILVNIDSLGDTAIYKLLLSGSDALLALVANYIASNSEIIKLDISDENIDELCSVIELPQGNLTPQNIMDTYITPLYNSESIEKIIKCCGDILDY